MFVADLWDSSLDIVPEKFKESLPEFCPYCHYPIEMSETFTGLHCSNPKCIAKNAQRLVSLCNTLGIKDMGESRAESFLEHFNNPSPLFLFRYNPDNDGALADNISMDVSRRIYDSVQQKKTFTLAEYVKVAQLPEIQTSAIHLFSEFNTLEDAYKPIDMEGVDYIARKLNIAKGESDVSIRALKVLSSLNTFRDELFEYEKDVTILQTVGTDVLELTAVCSDQVGNPFKTKADFYATMNNHHPKLHITFLPAVNKSIDYLVWAGADGSQARYTNKVQKVEGYNKQYQEKVAKGVATTSDKEIPIVTAMQFMAICDHLLKQAGLLGEDA